MGLPSTFRWSILFGFLKQKNIRSFSSETNGTLPNWHATTESFRPINRDINYDCFVYDPAIGCGTYIFPPWSDTFEEVFVFMVIDNTHSWMMLNSANTMIFQTDGFCTATITRAKD